MVMRQVRAHEVFHDGKQHVSLIVSQCFPFLPFLRFHRCALSLRNTKRDNRAEKARETAELLLSEARLELRLLQIGLICNVAKHLGRERNRAKHSYASQIPMSEPQLTQHIFSID